MKYNRLSDELFDKIVADIIALSKDPNHEFNYGPDCTVESVDADAETGGYDVTVVIKNSDVKVNVLNAADGLLIRTCASIVEEADGSHTIVYYGM